VLLLAHARRPRLRQDHYDVKMPCHMLLAKLAAAAGEAVLAHLERLVPPLEATLAAKNKSDAVKQEARAPPAGRHGRADARRVAEQARARRWTATRTCCGAACARSTRSAASPTPGPAHPSSASWPRW